LFDKQDKNLTGKVSDFAKYNKVSGEDFYFIF